MTDVSTSFVDRYHSYSSPIPSHQNSPEHSPALPSIFPITEMPTEVQEDRFEHPIDDRSPLIPSHISVKNIGRSHSIAYGALPSMEQELSPKPSFFSGHHRYESRSEHEGHHHLGKRTFAAGHGHDHHNGHSHLETFEPEHCRHTGDEEGGVEMSIGHRRMVVGILVSAAYYIFRRDF